MLPSIREETGLISPMAFRFEFDQANDILLFYLECFKLWGS